MKNITFIPKIEVDERDLRDFVIKQGGIWNDKNALRSGAFQSGGGNVYVDIYENYLMEFGEVERRTINRVVGFLPTLAFSLHVGHGLASEHLLSKVVNIIHERWGVIILDCGNSFDSDFGSVVVLSPAELRGDSK